MFVKRYSPDKLWSADEYLAWESAQEFKNELIDKRVWLMLGAGLRHASISVNLILISHNIFEERDFTALGSRACLQIDPESTFVYPDFMLFARMPQEHFRFNQCFFKDPTVVFEILSPSTENMDRGRKKELYLQLESLQTYILISQDRPLIEAHTRKAGDWGFRICSGMDASLAIPALDCKIPLREVYRRVNFEDD